MSKQTKGVKMSYTERSRLRSERWIRIAHTKWRDIQKGERFTKAMICLWSLILWSAMIIIPIAIVAFIVWLVIGSTLAVVSAFCVMFAVFSGLGDGISRSSAPKRYYFW